MTSLLSFWRRCSLGQLVFASIEKELSNWQDITRSPSSVFICDYFWHPPQKVGRLVHQLLLRVTLSACCNKMADKNVEKLFRSYFRSIPSQVTNLHKFIVFFQGPMKMQCQRIYWFVCEVFFEFCQTFAILWIEKPPRGEDWLKRYVSSSNKIVTIITFPVVHCCYIP